MKKSFLLFPIIMSLLYTQSVEIKDSADQLLLQINDEGDNQSSITIPLSGTTFTPTDNKLYNEGGILKWNGSALGSGGSSLWTLNGGNVYRSSGNVGIGTINPLAKLSVGGDGEDSATIYGASSGEFGRSISGYATGLHGTALYGLSEGDSGNGVFGLAWSTNGVGVWGSAIATSGQGVRGEASGIGGRGVFGSAIDDGITENFGGYFVSDGIYGRGVYSRASGTEGRALYGEATNTGEFTNYGGYFEANGTTGRGVFGFARDSGDNENFGGYFRADGAIGQAVYGFAVHSSGVNFGIRGKTNSIVGWAGYFEGRGYFSENVGIGTSTPNSKLSIVGLDEYANNAAALAGGLAAGDLYRTATGILMVTY